MEAAVLTILICRPRVGKDVARVISRFVASDKKAWHRCESLAIPSMPVANDDDVEIFLSIAPAQWAKSITAITTNLFLDLTPEDVLDFVRGQTIGRTRTMTSWLNGLNQIMVTMLFRVARTRTLFVRV